MEEKYLEPIINIHKKSYKKAREKALHLKAIFFY